MKFLPPLAEGDMTRRCPDTTKMKALLNRPQVGLEDGIRRLAAYQAEQEEADVVVRKRA
jgi:hypothetical protein